MKNLEKILFIGILGMSLLIPKSLKAQEITKHYFNNPNKIEVVQSLDKTAKEIINSFVQPNIKYSEPHWDNLKKPEKRLIHIDSTKAIDKTDTLLYIPNERECSEFKIQTMINFHGYNGDIPSKFDTTNNGKFNLPVYTVYISNPLHGFNCILIGDDPLKWNDWYFFEPQDDKPVVIGDWNLDKNSEVWIQKITRLEEKAYWANNFIKFLIQDSIATCTYYDTGYVVLERPAPVPVELASFFVKEIIDDDVVLNWTTLSETNNYGFDVERSRNGKDFSKIGFVKGKGTIIEENKYSLRDQDLNPGDYFYRLKQVDFDGSFEYSNILEALIKTPEKFTLKQNYPNPFNPITTIEYKIPKSSHVLLKIYNLLGQELETLVGEYQVPGSYEMKWNASKYSSGIYFYKIKTDDFIKTKEMTFLK